MRLVDANALIAEMHNIILEDGEDRRTFYEVIERQPTIEERNTGKWIDKHHAYFDEENAIEEWQSCKCSECGRYDTRPYMYYFNEPHFCSWCGADMRERREE